MPGRALTGADEEVDYPFGSRTVRTFVVAREAIIREGVTRILEGARDFVVVGQAATARVALGGILTLRPDLVITDVVLPAGDGVDLIREVRRGLERTTCMILSSSRDVALMRRAWAAGAVACMMLETPSAEFLRVCRDAANGRVTPMAAADDSAPRIGTAAGSWDVLMTALPDHLTPQERRILLLLGRGMTNREIATALFLSERTVRNYVSNVLDKLDVTNRTQAATYVTRLVDDLRNRTIVIPDAIPSPSLA